MSFKTGPYRLSTMLEHFFFVCEAPETFGGQRIFTQTSIDVRRSGLTSNFWVNCSFNLETVEFETMGARYFLKTMQTCSQLLFDTDFSFRGWRRLNVQIWRSVTVKHHFQKQWNAESWRNSGVLFTSTLQKEEFTSSHVLSPPVTELILSFYLENHVYTSWR